MPRLDVQQGQDVSGPLSNAITSGAEVVIPGGTYALDNPHALEAIVDANTTIRGDGMVTLDTGDQTMTSRIEHEVHGATLRFENITIDGFWREGKSGYIPRVYGGGGIEYENFHQVAGISGNLIGWVCNPGVDSGYVRWNNCTIANFSNNGIYGGKTGGRLEVLNSYLKNNNIDQVRIGSTGDLVEGNVFVQHDDPPDLHGGVTGRGIRMDNDGHPVVRDNDFIYDYAGASSPIVVSNAVGGGTLELWNNRIHYDGDDPVMRARSTTYPEIIGGGNQLTGSYTNVESPFEHVVACAGSHCEPPREDPGGDPFEPDHVIAIVCTEDGAELDYTIEVSGRARKVQDGTDMEAEANDTIRPSGDGYAIDGFTGNAGFGDTYEIEGSVQNISLTSDSDEDAIEVRRDGTDVTEEFFGDGGGGGGPPVDEGPPNRRRAGMAVGAAVLIGLALRNREK